MKSLSLLLLTVPFLINCASTMPYYPTDYSDIPTLETSLFPSDQLVLSQAAIDTILSSRIVIPDNSKLAIIKFPGALEQNSSKYGYGYWRSEQYLSLQQSYVDTLISIIDSSEKINSISLLPSLLTPQSPTIPILREAAVRLQAPLLVVYRINSDIYQEYRMFRSTKAKAYATVEIVLLDIRTGIIPFTAISTKEAQSAKRKSDANDQDLFRRTEQDAVNKALNTIANDLVAFLNSN